MKRIIYEPAIGETVPSTAVTYTLPVSGMVVVDVLVDDSFTTAGTVRYDSLAGISLSDTPIHQFAGWEIQQNNKELPSMLRNLYVLRIRRHA